jgi:hypothetical protein
MYSVSQPYLLHSIFQESKGWAEYDPFPPNFAENEMPLAKLHTFPRSLGKVDQQH